MLRANIGVLELLGLFASLNQHFAYSGRVGQRAFGRSCAGDDALFNFGGQVGNINTGVLHDADGNALTKLEQAQEYVFSAYVVVVETVCLAACDVENLLSAWGEVVIHAVVSEKW